MSFKQFILESGRDVSKKFKIYQDDHLSNYQEVDIETVRNIIVNKMAKMLAEKPSLQGKTREEIEDSIRLREIKQSMGDLFVFKYSIFNRPLLPHSIHIDQSDWDTYEHDKADFIEDDNTDNPDENEDVESDTADSVNGQEDLMPKTRQTGSDNPISDFRVNN